MRRKWGNDVFALETSLVKRLYAVSGSRQDVHLTAFQQKNREQSLYRGMELFLEYRNEHFPDAVMYAPVLFDRGTTLDAYPSILDDRAPGGDRESPVIEVVNLLAGIPIPRRTSEAVHFLADTLHKSIVRKDARKALDFGIVGDEFGTTTDPIRRLETAFSFSSRKSDDRAAEEYGNFADTHVLRRFAPLALLNEPKLGALARAYPLQRAAAGISVIRRGATDSFSIFLVAGKLELEAADGVRQIIEGGSVRAVAPIANLKPRKYHVRAITPVIYLSIPDTTLAAVTPSRAGVSPG